MAKNFFIAPVGFNVGINSVCFGLLKFFDERGIKVGYFRPILATNNKMPTEILKHYNLEQLDYINYEQAQEWISSGKSEELADKVLNIFDKLSDKYDVILVEALVFNSSMPFVSRINSFISNILSSNVILVSYSDDIKKFIYQIKVAADLYGGINSDSIVGCILNKMNSPKEESILSIDGNEEQKNINVLLKENFTNNSIFNDKFKLLGFINWNSKFSGIRFSEFIEKIKAKVINQGDSANRKITKVLVATREVSSWIDKLKADTLVVAGGDRADVFITVALAELKGIKLAGLLLTNKNCLPTQNVIELAQASLDKGLPVVSTDMDTFESVMKLSKVQNNYVNDIDFERELSDYIVSCLDKNVLMNNLGYVQKNRMSPSAFKHNIIKKAIKSKKKKIVLPEGNEERTIKAAIQCYKRQIAEPILLGKKQEIEQIASLIGENLPVDLTIINPESIREKYIKSLLEIRSKKHLTTETIVAEELENNVLLGIMMLHQGDVDGLVSGAKHTTASLLSPAFQIIKTKPESKLVSSVFFMCLPEQVLVYSDCAVNPSPNSRQLACIAIDSSKTANSFGINPKIAMISYSTGDSGVGVEVEKVKQATKFAKEIAPQLSIDGPLQYDAAIVADVAATKAPNSDVAGQSNVFIFPDLNTGNTTYKAVQRSSNSISIGPILQGLNKPVNDLSRGCLVDDIVYTIAITVIQANSN